MPIKRVSGGWASTYGGNARTFKTKSAAETWAAKFKATNKNTRAGTGRSVSGPKKRRLTSKTKNTPRY